MAHKPKRNAHKGRAERGKGNPAPMPSENRTLTPARNALHPHPGSGQSSTLPGVSPGLPGGDHTAAELKAQFNAHAKEAREKEIAWKATALEALKAAYAHNAKRAQEAFPYAIVRIVEELALVTSENVDNIEAAFQKLKAEGKVPAEIHLQPGRMRILFVK